MAALIRLAGGRTLFFLEEDVTDLLPACAHVPFSHFRWTIDDTYDFLITIMDKDQTEILKEQRVDGEALLLLTQKDITDGWAFYPFEFLSHRIVEHNFFAGPTRTKLQLRPTPWGTKPFSFRLKKNILFSLNTTDRKSVV